MAVVAVNNVAMIEVLEHKKAAKYAERYFDKLTKTGYVKRSTMRNYLRYMFFIDFIDYMYPFITDAAYDDITRVLQRLFSNGDCLLTYPMFCQRRSILGLPIYLGSAKLRSIQDESNIRITENSNLRGV